MTLLTATEADEIRRDWRFACGAFTNSASTSATTPHATKDGKVVPIRRRHLSRVK